uniref:HAD family hydrolase n=1 Tax=Anisakis simplex TaxID=6269 RepID=A0A0M3KDD3_ANISI
LISFDEMWIPWAQIFAKCIVESTKLEITDEIYKTLNYSHELKRVLPGLLAQGTTAQIREALVRLLIAHGILLKDALNNLAESATLSALKTLGVDRFVRIIACGDDAGAIPKPNPHNALSICRQLDIDPQEAVVVGDTLADLGMGRTARLGCTVGVLSGVCGREHLSSYADFIIPDVGKLMPIVLNMPPNDATKPPSR